MSLDLHVIKRWQSSVHTLLGSEGSSITAEFLSLSVLKNFSGELFVVLHNMTPLKSCVTWLLLESLYYLFIYFLYLVLFFFVDSGY